MNIAMHFQWYHQRPNSLPNITSIHTIVLLVLGVFFSCISLKILFLKRIATNKNDLKSHIYTV